MPQLSIFVQFLQLQEVQALRSYMTHVAVEVLSYNLFLLRTSFNSFQIQ